MRVFVLTTGRSGSSSFAAACSHISNFSIGHESRWQLLGSDRLNYPDQHIEVDNRLSWLLGRLDDQFGNEPFYVHLIRDRSAVANSYCQRRFGRKSIIRAYSLGILYRDQTIQQDCLDYYDTVNSNIKLFLKDKTKKMSFILSQADHDFRHFWNQIRAEGDLQAALNEWKAPHNTLKWEREKKNDLLTGYEKLKRIARNLPDYIKNV